MFIEIPLDSRLRRGRTRRRDRSIESEP